jgi:hypothetical protein
MATEEPVGFTSDGKLITHWRWTDADRADIMMAGGMHAASPDGQSAIRRFMDGLPDASLTIEGHWD